MDKYSLLREFAQSWGLFAMLLVFLLVLVRTFRPSGKKDYKEAANIVLLRGDDLEDDLKTIEKTNDAPRKEART